MVRPQIGHGPKATLEEYYVSQEAQELIPESRKELVFPGPKASSSLLCLWLDMY